MSPEDEVKVSYKVLELPVGAPQAAIRRSFRQLAKRHHPDRFSSGSEMERFAQEKMKAINQAYERLSKHKPPGDLGGPTRHGPKTAAVDPEEMEREARRRRGARMAYQDEDEDDPGPAPKKPAPAAGKDQPKRERRWRPVWQKVRPKHAFAFLCLAAAALAAARPLTGWLGQHAQAVTINSSAQSAEPADPKDPPPPQPDVQPGPVAAAKPTDPAASQAQPIQDAQNTRNPREIVATNTALDGRVAAAAPAGQPVATAEIPAMHGLKAVFIPKAEFPDVQAALDAAGIRGYFTVGSTKAEVVASQGKPDAFSENAYQYGSSIVHFQNGVVESWQQGNPPLRARLPFDRLAAGIGRFTVGSGKEEVFALQGKPDSSSPAIFQYGSSVVYFSNERVIGWLEGSPPLKARRPIDLVRSLLGPHFHLGSTRSEVIAAQGRPDAATDTEYVYGSSVVKFAGGLVVSWSEGTPLLKVRAR